MMRPNEKITFKDFQKQASWLSRQLLVAYWSERLHWSGIEIVDDELMTRTRSQAGHCEFNNVLLTRVRQAKLDLDLDRCLAILAAEAKPARWFLSNENPESEITEQLMARGFDDYRTFFIVATDLNAEHACPWQAMKPVDGDSVSEITRVSELKQYSSILAQTYDFSNSFENSWFDMLLSCGVGPHLPWRYYLYRVDDEPVGILGALWADQVIAIEMVSVLPQYRNRRVASALVHKALSDAQQAGYEVALAYPTESAEGLYCHYGFSSICRLDCVTIDCEVPVQTRAEPTTTPSLLLGENPSLFKDTAND